MISTDKIEIQCPTLRKLLPPAPLRIIKMPCQCTMATGNMYLPAVMTTCNGTTVMLALNVVNLAQVLAYGISIVNVNMLMNIHICFLVLLMC